MKPIITILALSAMLAGCATGPTSYGPAQGRGLGYTQQQIENERFQIQFTGRTADEARNFALLRAAEITLEHDREFFRIVGAGTYGNRGQGSPITTSVGLGIGGGGFHRGGGTSVGVGIGIQDVGRLLAGNQVTSSLEIILEVDNLSEGNNIYDARSIIRNLGNFAPQSGF